MPAAWSPVVVVPVAAFLSITYAALPRTAGTTAPLRLAVIRAALATGAYAVLVVEALGALDQLTAPAVTAAWLLFLLAALAMAGRRHRSTPAAHRDSEPPPDGPRAAGRRLLDGLGDAWRTASRGERLLGGTIGVLVLVELGIALLAEPNNFDSQTYHLPKVEHWVAQGNLDLWPTAIHRQVTIPPGAEYLLLHLRLLTGGDALFNLVQWAAGLGCLLVASRLAAQLGGGRRAQLLTAFVVATTPMVTLQATSTQTDLVAAAWTGCVATLVLDGLFRSAGAGPVLALGAATGLTAVTKTNGLLGAGPLLVLWGLAQLRLALSRRASPSPSGRAQDRPSTDAGAALGADPRPAGLNPAGAAGAGGAGAGASARGGRPFVGTLRTAGAALGILIVAAAITGPYLLRVTAEFGNPLGPPRLRESIPMQRHDPAAILINAARIGHTALDTPLTPLRDVTASGIDRLASAIGVDPQDRAITFGQSTFPVRAWYPDEDRVAFPLAGALALIGGVLALARPRRIVAEHAGTLRAYAATVAVALLLHAATIKWQPWGNRLLMYCLLLAAPLAGLWLDAMFRRRSVPGRRSVAAGLAVAVLAGSALAGVLAVSYGFPRRLVGHGSLLTTSDWDTRFLRRPQWAAEFRWAAGRVDSVGARRVGLVEQNDNWEYPWWLLLRGGAGRGGAPEIVALVSVLPDRPPADPRSVDAIVCTGDHAACARLVPPGWQLEFHDYVGVALPPPR